MADKLREPPSGESEDIEVAEALRGKLAAVEARLEDEQDPDEERRLEQLYRELRAKLARVPAPPGFVRTPAGRLMAQSDHDHLFHEHQPPPAQVTRAWKLSALLERFAERLCDPDTSDGDSAEIRARIDALWATVSHSEYESICRMGLLDSIDIASRRGGSAEDAQRLFSHHYPEEAERLNLAIAARLLMVWNRAGRPGGNEPIGNGRTDKKWDLAKDLCRSALGTTISADAVRSDWKKHRKVMQDRKGGEPTPHLWPGGLD